MECGKLESKFFQETDFRVARGRKMEREKEGSEWVTKYGMASISRPNDIAVHVDNDTDEDGGNGEGLSSMLDSIPSRATPGGAGDPPPAEIPPRLLPRLAKEAAQWNLAMALEARHSTKRRIIVTVLYNIGM